MGQNYLYTLQEKGNSVLFVNGDNETFPLWYSTEVENIRTDTRVCNLMYLSGGWYADQMKRQLARTSLLHSAGLLPGRSE